MPDWRDGLVDAFPEPFEEPKKPTVTTTAEEDTTIEPTSIVEPVTAPKASEAALAVHPFPFFDLPSELRNRIYGLILLSVPDLVLKKRRIRRQSSCLSLLCASQSLHAEASYVLYTAYAFRIFYLQEFTPLPLISELPHHYRELITNLEMRLGSDWTNPPRSWRVTKSLARMLGKMKSVQTLKVFITVDPSIPTFANYRISKEFYTDFCGKLFGDVAKAMPQLRFVELDGNPSVDVHGPLVSRLREVSAVHSKEVKYGKQAGWAYKV